MEIFKCLWSHDFNNILAIIKIKEKLDVIYTNVDYQ